ncbi:MAG: YcgL domain-containing protein [Arenicella sp.]|nr:YcgL domain-containing protein [Arenicella sp.]
MHCYVYKGANKEDLYLYLPEPATPGLVARLPAALTELFGKLTLVVDFDLTEKTLVQAESEQVIADMRGQGFYLQMPKKDMWLEEQRYFN